MRTRRLVTSICLALVVIGAHGAPASASARTCRYLKPAEVRRVLAEATVTRASSPPAPDDVTRCDYDVGDATDTSVHVWVQRDARDGFSVARKAFAADVEPVEGFGKRAFYVAGGFNVLYVVREGTLLSVQYSTPVTADDDVTKAAVGELMKIVLTRL